MAHYLLKHEGESPRPYRTRKVVAKARDFSCRVQERNYYFLCLSELLTLKLASLLMLCWHFKNALASTRYLSFPTLGGEDATARTHLTQQR